MIIYKIINDINDKVYIGQTIYSDISQRIRTYKKELANEKCKRPIIQAIREYGIEHFKWEILEENILTQKELDEKEVFYIKFYHSLTSENGYNADAGGRGQGPRSIETRKKIGDAQRGEKNHMYGKIGALSATSKPIIELTTGEIFESATEAAKKHKVNFSHVCAVARGERGSTGGYVYRYLDENNNIIQPEEIATIKFLKVRNAVLPQFKKYI